MKKAIEIISYISLLIILTAPIMFFMDKIALATSNQLILAATFVWFASATYLIGHEKETVTE